MTKKQIQDARELVGGKINELKTWLLKNHKNPYTSCVMNDVREYELEEQRLAALDLEAYPTMDEVAQLTGKELLIMFRTLGKPSNDEEVKVLEHVKNRISQYKSQY